VATHAREDQDKAHATTGCGRMKAGRTCMACGLVPGIGKKISADRSQSAAVRPRC
jgi:hypothetical protein